MNGEFVPWEDAKVHVLSHGLHYGTGGLRGHPLLRDRARPGGLPPPRPPRAARQSAELYYLPLPYTAEQIARRPTS